MPQVHIDHIETLSVTEDRGVVTGLSRKVRVEFSATERAAAPGFDIASAALTACDTTTPSLAAMSIISSPVSPPSDRWGALTLVKRSAGLVDKDPGFVDVTLEYQHLTAGANQEFVPNFGAPSGVIFGKGKTSIVEKTSNFYYPYGVKTNGKTPIVVSHKYPYWDTSVSATSFDPNFPRTVFQGGEISIPFPQSNFGFSAIVTTNNPGAIEDALVAAINLKPWVGRPALTWICSEVTWEINNPMGNSGKPFPFDATDYRMSFEFQYNFDTWNPTVVFNDARTGRPPFDVELATIANPASPLAVPVIDYVQDFTAVGSPYRPAGAWEVPALRRIDFDAFFNALFR